MNYKKIHDSLINHIKTSLSRDRLARRNPNDHRLNEKTLYVEIHHIIPRSLGGLDVQDNLVEVLPEEHLFLHMLRYKIYHKREDALAVRCMLNGFVCQKARIQAGLAIGKKIRMGYAWLRSHSAFLRKTEGWHTPDGVKRISEARKGTMPARDISTGKIIGAVDVNHPNVLSGKWVHHSKGRKQSQKEIDDKRQRYAAQKNPNASGLSEQYFIDKGIELYYEFGRILSWGEVLNLSSKRGFKWIKSLKSRFDGKGIKGYYEILEEKTKTKYNPYFTRQKHD